MRPNVSRILAASLAGIVMLSAMSMTMSTTPLRPAGESKEFFLEEEIDYLRDAQGLSQRAPAIIRLANIRLVSLAMKTKSKEDKALEKRIAEIHDELTGKLPSKTATRPADKTKPASDDGPGPYLTDLTRVELLRGYIEALDEVRRVIDDAYSQKQEVRGALEQLEGFCNDTNPLLRRFQPRSPAESQAILDARSATQEALEETQDALKKVPKTEKSYKP